METSMPSRSRRSATCDPINPAPPVTRTLTVMLLRWDAGAAGGSPPLSVASWKKTDQARAEQARERQRQLLPGPDGHVELGIFGSEVRHFAALHQQHLVGQLAHGGEPVPFEFERPGVELAASEIENTVPVLP